MIITDYVVLLEPSSGDVTSPCVEAAPDSADGDPFDSVGYSSVQLAVYCKYVF